MPTTTSRSFYLSFVPGDFERHASASLDGPALCGDARAVPQGERRPAAALRVECEHCLRTLATPDVLAAVLGSQPRERSVPCSRCTRSTWNFDALCDECRKPEPCECCDKVATTDTEHEPGCPLAQYDSPGYVTFLDEQLAIHEGRATLLVHCYLCEPDVNKRLDKDAGPLRGVLRESVGGAQHDPSTVMHLNCGHAII